MKKKNIVVTLLLVLGLLSITIGVSVAFFNYTRTGSENVLAVGRIYFNSSQGTSINLTNVFPVKSNELENNDNVSSVTLTITGDTTYDEGLEYLVSADQVVNTVNSKKVPIGTSVTVSNLGTSDDEYFENRGGNSSIYKVLSKGNIKEDGELVVGYITKGATGVNGTVTISAWLDGDKLAVSDTYDGEESDNNGTTNEWVGDRTVLTTTEWNSLQSSGVSFKLKVEANEGIWVVEPLTALDKIKKKVNTTTLINFGENSSTTNGKGLYILPGTESNTNPIYYYRGEIENNNVLFAGYCWQMVRTTDTGGIKMIYNGMPDIEESDVGTKYNCGSRKLMENIITTTSLYSSSGFYYADDYEILSTGGYRLKQKTNEITNVEVTSSNASTAISDIAANYPYTCRKTTPNATCKNLYKIDSYDSGTSAKVYVSSNIALVKNSSFSEDGTSISDIGYMSNTRYHFSYSNWTNNALFGSDAIWNGNSYTLTNANTVTPDSTHHYSCNAISSDVTCASVRYVYNVSGGGLKSYIILTNGEKIEDALYKMTGNGDAEVKTRNSDYSLNVNNSVIKTTIDNWFRTNLTSELDANNPDYSAYLEDTVYCNDRSFKTVEGNTSLATYLESGWNPNGGDMTKFLFFGSADRVWNNWYSTTNIPSVDCSNELDKFTVSRSNGNGSLIYPVGLLTADEIVMAGASGRSYYNTTYYLYTGGYAFFSLSANSFYNDGARLFSVGNDGKLDFIVSFYDGGLRPVVSLKPGIEFETDGDGTPTNPYIVKYN